MIVHESTNTTSKGSKSRIIVEAYDPLDMLQIKPQLSQADFLDKTPTDFHKTVDIDGLSKTIFNDKWEIISVCGVIPIVNHEGVAWAIHSELFKDHAIEVTRATRDFFDDLSDNWDFVRFIGSVEHGFDDGHRWMKLLSFTRNDQRNDLGEGHTLYERLV